jgi:hypothetical protein
MSCRKTARTSEQAPRAARSASGIVGVCYSPDVSRANPWRAQIGVNKRLIHLGMLATETEAAGAPAAAERELREPNGR